jgi:hypothetical protein
MNTPNCTACKTHYGDTGICDEGKPAASPHRFENDIPLDLAVRAHAGTSHVPDDRGRQERAGYAATLHTDVNSFGSLVDTDEKRAIWKTEFDQYRQGYRARYIAMLEAKSRCVSTMITGGSNFNVRRAKRTNDRADRRTQELIEYRTRALAAIRKVLQPELAPIMTGDADAGERLADKIAKLEATRAKYKEINARIRNAAKEGEAAQIAALVDLGYKESTARNLLTPDFAGRVGIPAYELTNIAANIRRLKSRAVVVERNQTTPETTIEGAAARVEEVPAENRVRLFFPGKPDVQVRTTLKSSGFRWTPSIGCWQAYLNAGTVATARRIAGVEA